MNSFIKHLVQRVQGNVHILRKQHYRPSSQIWKYPLNMEPLIQTENRSIANLVQKNIISFTGILPKASILDKPLMNILPKAEINIFEKVDIVPVREIEDPGNEVEKKANTMLIIKRKKMKRHQFEKKQKKYHYKYLRIRRKRTAKRENKFRNEIAMMLKDLEKFSPEEYVNTKLEKFRYVVLPNRIHGCRMPPFAVKEFLEKREERKQTLQERLERRKKFMAEHGGSMNVPQS